MEKFEKGQLQFSKRTKKLIFQFNEDKLKHLEKTFYAKSRQDLFEQMFDDWYRLANTKKSVYLDGVKIEL